MDAVLLPEDVSSADARRVLDFLNAVAGPGALADAVGFSEGREIGLAVAGEILAARRRDGSLGSLDALFGITRVTPGRFTEVVMALSAARAGRRSRGGSLDIAFGADPAWLGAPLAVIVTRRGGEGRPLPGAPVSLVASWGRLSGQDGLATRQGAAVTVRTGELGIARLDLAPPLDPPLMPDQRTALQAALARLPAAGADAGAVAAALARLAASYREGGSRALRAAVERLVAVEGVAPTGPGLPPAAQSVSIIAIADGGAGPITVADLTVLDWRGPFLGALAAAVRSGDRLDALLDAYAPDAEPDLAMARGLLAAAAAAKTAETGLLARRFEPEATLGAIGRFLDERATADAGAGAGLETLVRAAGSVEAAGGLATIEGIEVIQDVRGTGGIASGVVADLDGRIGLLEDTAVDRTALDRFGAELVSRTERLLGDTRTDLEDRIAALPDRDAFDALEAGLRTKAGTEDLSALRNRLAAAEDGLAGKADASTLTDLGTRLDGAFEAVGTLEGRIGALDVTFGTLRTDLAAKADTDDLGAVASRLDGAEAVLTGLEGRLTGFDTTVGTVRAELAEKADGREVAALGSRLGTAEASLEGKVDADAFRAVASRLSTAEHSVSALSDRSATLDGALAGLRREIASLEATKLAEIEQSLTSLQSSLREIDGRVGVVDARIEGLAESVGTLETTVVSVDDLRRLSQSLEALQVRTARLTREVNEVQTGVEAVRTDLTAKADATTVTAIERDLTKVRTENQQLTSKVNTMNTRVSRLTISPIFRPPR